MATEATHITFAEDAIHRVGSNGRPSSYKAASIKEKEAGLDVEDGVREGEMKQKQVCLDRTPTKATGVG